MFEVSSEGVGYVVVVAVVGHRRHGPVLRCSSFYDPANKGLTANGRVKPIVEAQRSVWESSMEQVS